MVDPVKVPQKEIPLASKDEAEDEEKDKDDEEDNEEAPIKRRRRRGDDDLDDFELQKGLATGNVFLGLKGAAVRLGGRAILQDASWVVKTGDKLALVGANGCGKTTQLRILTEELHQDEGEVVRSSPNIKISTLSQTFVDELDPERTLKEELLAAVPSAQAVMQELQEVQNRLDE